MRSGARTLVWLLLFSMTSLAACGDPPEEPPVAAAELALASAVSSAAPRLLSPLSSTIATSSRPVLRWLGGRHQVALVEVCGDRACAHRLATFLAHGGSARPPFSLPAGTVFWRVTGLHRARLTSSAVWQLVIPARESGRSSAWGSVPDFNGDGFSDLEVTVKAVGTNPAPKLRIFPGGPDGPTEAPAQTFTGPSGFGDESGPVGDLDGDGFCDLAVWNGTPPNAVTVYRGGPGGVSSPVTFPAPNVEFGAQARVVSAGDVNGDGYGDMLVGGGTAAQLFLGGPTGVNTTAAQDLPSGFDNSERVTGGGDFNGDGFADVIVGSSRGGARVYEGNGAALVEGTTIPFSFGGLGGDFNGDGFADVSQSSIFAGGPGGGGGQTDPFTDFLAAAGIYFYASAGDTNGDGFSDALAFVSSLVGVPEGERLYLGRASRCSTTDCQPFVPLLVPGTLTGGPSIATGAGGLGDTNGDGYSDFVFFQPFSGAVFLFFGSAAGPPSTPSRTITAEQGFGYSVGRL